MVNVNLSTILLVAILYGNIGATPQLDLPIDNNSTHVRTRVFDDPPINRVRTNGHANKAAAEPAISGDQSNEVGISDTLNYDRDRSHRYGPPYYEENDRRFYNDNSNPRYGNQNYGYRDDDRNNENRYDGRGYDNDDDKYHVQNGPKNNDYYISEKQRSLYGYRDYYSVVCDIFEIKFTLGF